MTELKNCANCRKECKTNEMKTIMSNVMHYYVCSYDCMKKFYEPKKVDCISNEEIVVKRCDKEKESR